MFRLSPTWLILWISIGFCLPFTILNSSIIGITYITSSTWTVYVALILNCLYYLLVWFGVLFIASTEEAANQSDETEHDVEKKGCIHLFMYMAFFILTWMAIRGWMQAALAVGIHFAPKQIVSAKMVGAKIMINKSRWCETTIQYSEIPELIGHSLQFPSKQCQAIKHNPNVKLAVRQNAAGMSVEVLQQ